MGRRAGILPLAALLLPAAGQAAEGASYSLASARATPMPQLAEALLGSDRAADVTEVLVSGGGIVPSGLFSIQFLHKPVPVEDRFCQQQRHYVSFVDGKPIDPDVPLEDIVRQASGVHESMLVALAPGCQLADNQLLMHLNFNIPVATGMAALLDLEAVQRQARGNQPLPFALTCEDQMNRDQRSGSPDCTAEARTILAGLPAERAGIMNPGMIILFLENKDEWIISTAGLGTDSAAVALTRRGIVIRH